jgi:hypothetical protein
MFTDGVIFSLGKIQPKGIRELSTDCISTISYTFFVFLTILVITQDYVSRDVQISDGRASFLALSSERSVHSKLTISFPSQRELIIV